MLLFLRLTLVKLVFNFKQNSLAQSNTTYSVLVTNLYTNKLLSWRNNRHAELYILPNKRVMSKRKAIMCVYKCWFSRVFRNDQKLILYIDFLKIPKNKVKLQFKIYRFKENEFICPNIKTNNDKFYLVPTVLLFCSIKKLNSCLTFKIDRYFNF